MGTGTYAKQCQKYFPNASIEGVEIDQKITNLASKYFKLPNTIKVNTYDGRAYLNSENKKYDVIMVDAYQDITIPFQMSSKEFFTIVKNHLAKDGIMVVNMKIQDELSYYKKIFKEKCKDLIIQGGEIDRAEAGDPGFAN